MLFQKSLRKELARSFGATLVVLVTIVMTMILIRILGQASAGKVNPTEIGLIMGYNLIGQMPTVLTLSLFVATVGTISRMYMESEMVIWLSSGQSMWSFVRPIIQFTWPTLIVVFVLVIFVWPWSNRQTIDLKERFERRGDLERVAPGQFQESANGLRVFFIDKSSLQNKQGKNVFISATDHGKQSMTSSHSGHIEMIGEDRFLMLETGQRVEQGLGQVEMKVSEFKVYGTRTNEDSETIALPSTRAIPTVVLLQNPTPSNMGEFSWRVGLIASTFNLMVIALAITSANPRVGRGGNLALAMLMFLTYTNFINLGQALVNDGKIQWLVFLFTLHGGTLLLSLAWLTVRANNWSWRQLLPRNKKLQPQ